MDLRAFLSKVDWTKVKRISVSQNGAFHSFSVEVGKQKRIINIGVGPGTTTLTVTEPDGRILSHVVQRGREMVYYEPQAGASPKLGNPLDALMPIHFVAVGGQDSDFSERGI